MNKIIQLKTEEELEKILSNTNDIVVLYFSAVWSPECQQTQIIFQENVKNPDLNNMLFIKLEAEEFERYVLSYQIEIVPTFVFLKNQKIVDRIDGVNPILLNQKLNQWAITFPTKSFTNMHISEHQQNVNAHDSLNDKLKKLINSSTNMLFMKGSPNQPQCGLKVYSDWPTYPQLYSKGELIGGLDIVKELDQMGDLKSTLVDLNDKKITKDDTKEALKTSKPENLNSRLKQLINQAPVMVFMKGHPSNPLCKFSKALVPLLDETKVPYQSFDIFDDEDVRQGLKKYSDWPTYPQIYVNGEFIGGLDIIKELDASGQLISTLRGNKN